ncbi:MAG: acyl-CoA dehydrogenase [Thermodesulfobacteriota bacterium]
MGDKFCSKRNLKFLLYEVFDAVALTRYPYYSAHTRQVFDMIVDAALALARDLYYPVLTEMDRRQPELVDGRVHVHPAVKKILAASGEGGWISAGFPVEHGGDQVPMMLVGAGHFIFSAANYSAGVYPEGCLGAAHLITSFGTPELVKTYVPHMLAGKWQGTMALTEPQAGSSLGDITTQAEPTDQGDYRISGRKVFISMGDHDGAENIVHLMLARITGAPAGVKGISLFVVPRLRPEAGGRLAPNDITVSQVFHKLGYRGAPITELSLGDNGDCRGILLGEANRGLKYMFQMMNEARLSIGMAAAGIASAAYYASLEYARGRTQGRPIMERDATKPQIPIIAHADVKRMLLFQRAVVEGSLSLILQCCQYADLEKVTEGGEKEKNALLLDLLTPVVKTYPSEMGILSVSAGLQCLGGYGYCDDFPLEQYYRDIRIHPIHEGTTGIQGMDLLGRKMVMKEGKALMLFATEVAGTIAAAEKRPALAGHAAALKAAMDRMQEVVMHLVGVAQAEGPETFLADAVLFLEMFSIIAVGWQWLLQAVKAAESLDKGPTRGETEFYQGKLFTCRYFFGYEMPKTLALAARLMDKDPLTVKMDPAFFND